MLTERDQLIRWLNDAYTMELAIEESLSKHAAHAEDCPDWHDRLQEHLEETRNHANLVRRCIERLGGSVSTSRAVIGEILGRLRGLSTVIYKDELIKTVLADYAVEHFEIACYESLIVAAAQAAQPEIVAICDEILAEEMEMADWLRTQIPSITAAFLLREPATAS
jgi:ferritin-like metal-binding protein YciE